MEQTNLVVTPDGKTWDEVTRDVSYMGTQYHRWGWTTNYVTSAIVQASLTTSPWICRGLNYGNDYGNKNFALAYDRHICLRDGKYEIYASSYKASGWGHWKMRKNGTIIKAWSRDSSSEDMSSGMAQVQLKRGDYIQVEGGHNTEANNWGTYFIRRMES